MHVAVSIVGFRNSKDIQGCLEALEASTHTDFEVVICENGGQASYEALMAVLPQTLAGGQPVHIVCAPGNLGYGGGVNVCLRAAPEADAWWVLNPDTRAFPGSLAAQLTRLQAGNCDAVGCALHLPNGSVQSYGGLWQGWLARAVSIGHGSPIAGRPDVAAIERTQNYLNGASMLIGRHFLEIAGPMREEYFLYCEEVEWFLRGLKRGLKLGYAPDAAVLHYQGATTGNQTDITKRPRLPVYLTERNKILLTRDCYAWRLPIVAMTSLAVLVLRYARRGAWKQFSYGVSGWLAGLRDERGVPNWVQP